MIKRINRYRESLLLLTLFLLAFLVRVGVGFLQDSSFWVQADVTFWNIAKNLVESGEYSLSAGVPTILRAPAYPLLLALFYWLFDSNHHLLIAANSLVNTAVVVLTYFLGRLIFGRQVGVVAACLVAFYPYLVWQSHHMIDTGLLSLLVLALVYAILKAETSGRLRWVVVAGVMGGMAFLTRSIVILFVGAVPFWWFWANRSRNPRLGAHILLFFAVLVLCVLPWVTRNAVVFDRLVLAESPVGGQNLWRGNNPLIFSIYPEHSVDSFWPYESRLLRPYAADPFQSNNWYVRQAIDYIVAHPVIFACNTLRKAMLFYDWDLVPRSRQNAVVDGVTGAVLQHGPSRPLAERIIYTSSYVAIVILAGGGLPRAWRANRQATLLAGLLFASWTLLHAIMVPVTRYRMPLEPFLIIWSAYGFCLIFSRSLEARKVARWPLLA